MTCRVKAKKNHHERKTCTPTQKVKHTDTKCYKPREGYRQLQYTTSFAARDTELQCDFCIHALHEPCTSSAMV